MTIQITKNQINQCAFTLNESTSIVGAKYILQIESKATNTSKLTWLEGDESLRPERLNLYSIEEVPLDQEDLAEMKVNLVKGDYNFYVWETEASALNLDLASSIIESGQLEVKEVETVIINSIVPNQKHIYNPNL